MDDEKDYQSAHQECALSDTDVFTPAFVQTDIKQGVYEDVYPISKLNDNGPVEFVVKNASEMFLDLANTYFKFSLKIVKADGADLDEDEKVAPVNYIFGALASQVDVSLGGTRIFAESKVVDLIGKIHSDIFNQGKLILNGLTLKVTLLRNKPEFMLLSPVVNADYKVVITEAIMCLRKVQLTPHKFEEIQRRLEKEQANYPLDRIDIRTHSAATGLSSFVWHNAYQGQMPSKIVVGVVDNSSYVGNYKENPFNFAHHSIRKVGVFINGESLPGKPIIVNFTNGQYLEGYKSLFDIAGTFGADDGSDIPRIDYKNGYALFGFDISQSLCRGGHQQPKRRGTLKIELEFHQALAKTATVIVYSQFENTISIDKYRNVIKDY
ncbi:uncharacterized protein F54H12.2-like [Clytia hemisphaerica]|uniref:uncharacterized protein F54H12.2-like n=1 Tax=Clytia hemisphaerica TaxID=252671 RepID=UPI0034D43A11